MTDLYKTKAERVKEGVAILMKLKEVGVRVIDPGYIKAKQFIDTWIKDGETISERFYFPLCDRKAEIILPRKKVHVASLRLFANEN